MTTTTQYRVRFTTDPDPAPYAEGHEADVYLQCEVQRLCLCCGQWAPAYGTGAIGFMDDAQELAWMDRWLTPTDLTTHKDALGYLWDVATQDLQEAETAEGKES